MPSKYYIWEKGEKARFTNNFSSTEFECQCNYKDCIEQRIHKDHVDKLQIKRDKWGRPVTITSAYRCQKHNRDIGGSKTSQHMKGNATDFVVYDNAPDYVADECEDFDGLGRYHSFTHVDSRGSKSRWDTRKK